MPHQVQNSLQLMAKRKNAVKVSTGKAKSKKIKKDEQSDQTPQQQEQNRQPKQETKVSELPAIKQVASDYNISFEGGVYKIKMHGNYQVGPDNKLYTKINSLFALFVEKQKKREVKMQGSIPYQYFPTFQFWLRGQDPTQQKCSICQFEYEDKEDFEKELIGDCDQDLIIFQCSHIFHKGCFKMLKGDKEWVRCPVCSTIYGVMMGDQPPGNMTWSVNNMMHCQGYQDVGTITINYSMNSTVRAGVHYQGTHRHAYLPDNPQGRQVLGLFHEAFKRKLIFTLGRSVTTGRQNQVVWNGIHHKTNLSGGSAYFGFPDPTYFSRVKLEMAAKGVK